MVFVAVGGWTVNEIDQQGMAAARSCTSTAVLAAAEEVDRPMATRMPPADRTSIAQGRFGVYNSFLFHAERAADRYGVSAHDLLRKFGAARAPLSHTKISVLTKREDRGGNSTESG